MKPMQLMAWGLLGLTIAMTTPAIAQERGDAAGEQGGDAGDARGDNSGDDDQGGRDGGRGDAGDDRDEASPGTSAIVLSEARRVGMRPPTTAIPVADTRRVGTRNTTTTGGPISEEELELTCGAGGWVETWLEDSDGNVIPGTYEYFCMDA